MSLGFTHDSCNIFHDDDEEQLEEEYVADLNIEEEQLHPIHSKVEEDVEQRGSCSIAGVGSAGGAASSSKGDWPC